MYPIHATLDKYNRPKTYQMSTQIFPYTTYYVCNNVSTAYLHCYAFLDDQSVSNTYRKSSIRSRPCIILDPNFLRLALEVFQKVSILQQTFFEGS